jgi:predicted porin
MQTVGTLSLLLLTSFIPSALAGTSEGVVHDHHTVQPTHSEERIGRRLHADETNAGFALGGGFGVEAFGSRERHDLVLATIYYGWIFTDVLAADHWYGGNFEILAEIVGGRQINPNASDVYGLSAVIRYNFAADGPWVPYVDGGFGVAYTDIGEPDLSSRFQFITQFGAGARYFFRQSTALIFQYRWFHLSNAGIEKPNNGTNTQMFYLGLDWFF